jgi:G3E family GTPase
MAEHAASGRIPVTIIGGYLGSGKTTLVNRLLRDADGLRLAVLVNEFGELPIDSDLIESQDGNVIGIAGGCVCCSYGNDLTLAMIDLAKMTPRPDHVLLEASGVALPGAVAASVSLLPDYATSGVIVLADAETVRERAGDRYMSDTVQGQLSAADIIILNKADLVPEHALDATGRWLSDAFDGARVVTAVHSELPSAVVLDSYLGRERDDHAHVHHQVDAFETTSFAPQGPVDATRLAERLADPELGLLRAKGFVETHDGTCMAIQVVGHRWQVLPVAAPVRTGIVCIGARAQFDADALRQIEEEFGAPHVPTMPARGDC